MSVSAQTLVGYVNAVSGGVVTVRLRDELTSSLLLVGGESYRVGQVGGYLRIPLGYAQLYGVCTQVGSAAIPDTVTEDLVHADRWLSLTLFGESIGRVFDRGVSQYPTVGDEVHLVTPADLEVIYTGPRTDSSITVGTLAAAAGIPATLDLAKLVSRHCAVVGATGSGKSNLVAVMLETIAREYPSARVLIIDPHGEYGSAVGDLGYVYRTRPEAPNERPLYVPYWALPFGELQAIGMGPMQSMAEAKVRDLVTEMKIATCSHLPTAPPAGTVTPDAPVPFNIREFWFALDTFERQTYQDNSRTNPSNPKVLGDAQTFKSSTFEPAASSGNAPWAAAPRNISKQLDLLKSRVQDRQYGFLFEPGPELTPDATGKTQADLGSLVANWVGHDRQLTVMNMSGIPSETLGIIVGTVLRIVYDTLFWAGDLGIGGRRQPLLVVLEEAHLFLPEKETGPAHRTAMRIAKEGRKYGVGLSVVTQRPTELDGTVLSQCSTMIALRLTNSRDKSRVMDAMPDDLGNLSSMLPSLRTGEALVIGEAVPIPSRMRFHLAANKPVGDDPNLGDRWRNPDRPDEALYNTAVARWRARSMEVDLPDQTGTAIAHPDTDQKDGGNDG